VSEGGPLLGHSPWDVTVSFDNVSEQPAASTFSVVSYPADGPNRFLQNVGAYLPNYTV
jgi:hypothetical protein